MANHNTRLIPRAHEVPTYSAYKHDIDIIPKVGFILESLLTSAPNMNEFVRTGLYHRSLDHAADLQAM